MSKKFSDRKHKGDNQELSPFSCQTYGNKSIPVDKNAFSELLGTTLKQYHEQVLADIFNNGFSCEDDVEEKSTLDKIIDEQIRRLK